MDGRLADGLEEFGALEGGSSLPRRERDHGDAGQFSAAAGQFREGPHVGRAGG